MPPNEQRPLGHHLEMPDSLSMGSVVHLTEDGEPISSGPDILQMLTEAEVARLADAGREAVYEPGQHLFHQGDAHDGIHFIRSGRVRSYYVAPSGREITLAYWPSGHFVGAPQILGGGEHMWTSVAVEPTVGLWIPGRRLKELLYDTPNLAIALIEGLAYKGMCYTALLQAIGTQSKTNRLGHLLLTLATAEPGRPNQACIDQPFTQEELANMVGSTRQSISSSFEKFEKLGLIRRDEEKLTITNVDGLRALCD